MKIVGVFNNLGFNPLEDQNFSWPLNLSVIYKAEDGQHYIKYLDSGGISTLISKFESMRDVADRDAELGRCLNGGKSITGFHNLYQPIKNKYYYQRFVFEKGESIPGCYCRLTDFPKDKVIIEPDYRADLETVNDAVLFPNKELYIGSGEFIYQKASYNLSIDNKGVNEIKGIICWLIQSMYLDEALFIINKIKLSGINLDEYKHTKNLMVFDGSDNFLDEQANRIEAMNYIKEKTKALNLHFFNK